MKQNSGVSLLVELGEGKTNFPEGIGVEIPEGYYLQIVQNGRYLPAIFESEVPLNEDYIPELEVNSDGTVDCRLFLIMYEFEMGHTYEECHADLNKGYPINYSFKLSPTKFTFAQPSVLLEHLFAFEEEMKTNIYFYESNLIGFIELTITKFIEDTLMLQPFFNVDGGTIEYETLSEEHQKFMDYISEMEVDLENFFDMLGIEVAIEIEDFETVCPVENFYIEEA